MESPRATVYRVLAHNTARDSENKIHDDAVARRFGFAGGLVPGVDVYAYMTHPLVERWGRDWLGHGSFAVRFVSPLYEGEWARVEARWASDGKGAEVVLRNPAGRVCAEGKAELREGPSEASPVPEAPLPDRKPPASPESLAPGTLLGSLAFTFRADEAANYLADVRESLELYSEHGLAHPGFLLRAANAILVANVELGPWIHTGSAVRHLGLVADGDRISVRGRVRDEYERKGHRFVELDVLLVERSRGPVLSVLHTAIYRPRPART